MNCALVTPHRPREQSVGPRCERDVHAHTEGMGRTKLGETFRSIRIYFGNDNVALMPDVAPVRPSLESVNPFEYCVVLIAQSFREVSLPTRSQSAAYLSSERRRECPYESQGFDLTTPHRSPTGLGVEYRPNSFKGDIARIRPWPRPNCVENDRG